MGPLRGAVFDFGGTLAYERDPQGLLAARRGVARDLVARGRENGAVDQLFARALADLAACEEAGRLSSALHVASYIADRWPTTLDPGERAAIARALVEPPQHPQALAVVPGARELLDEMRARGVRCAVSSNTGLSSGAFNRAWLERVGLLDHFVDGAVLFSDETGCAKPDPRAYARAAGSLGLEPREVVFIGDDLLFDVAGPRVAGMATVRLTTFGRARALPEADVVVERLSDVVAELDARARLGSGP